jgi:hypothetical protein
MRPHEDHTRFQGIDHTYPTPTTCQAPGCINQAAHKHHAWSRTALRKRGGGGWAAVVDTQTGEVIKNLVALCNFHHALLHSAHAELVWAADEDPPTFWWVPAGEGAAPLRGSFLLGEHHSSPGVALAEEGRTDGEAVQGASAGAAPPSSHLHPGEKCPTCERRIPAPREKTEKPRNKAKWAMHVPKDQQENGIEVLTTLLEEARKHLGRDEGCPPYFVVVEALALLLQTPVEKAA